MAKKRHTKEECDSVINSCNATIDIRMKQDDSTRAEAAKAVYREQPELRAAVVKATNQRSRQMSP